MRKNLVPLDLEAIGTETRFIRLFCLIYVLLSDYLTLLLSYTFENNFGPIYHVKHKVVNEILLALNSFTLPISRFIFIGSRLVSGYA